MNKQKSFDRNRRPQSESSFLIIFFSISWNQISRGKKEQFRLNTRAAAEARF